MKLQQILRGAAGGIILLSIVLLFCYCEYHPRTLDTFMSADGEHMIRIAKLGDHIIGASSSKYRIYYNEKSVLTFRRNHDHRGTDYPLEEWVSDHELEVVFREAEAIGFHFTFEEDDVPSVYFFVEYSNHERCAVDAEKFNIRCSKNRIRVVEYEAAKTHGESVYP